MESSLHDMELQQSQFPLASSPPSWSFERSAVLHGMHVKQSPCLAYLGLSTLQYKPMLEPEFKPTSLPLTGNMQGRQ